MHQPRCEKVPREFPFLPSLNCSECHAKASHACLSPASIRSQTNSNQLCAPTRPVFRTFCTSQAKLDMYEGRTSRESPAAKKQRGSGVGVNASTEHAASADLLGMQSIHGVIPASGPSSGQHPISSSQQGLQGEAGPSQSISAPLDLDLTRGRPPAGSGSGVVSENLGALPPVVVPGASGGRGGRGARGRSGGRTRLG